MAFRHIWLEEEERSFGASEDRKWVVETEDAIKAAFVREKENLHSALMALMTSHERALEDLRVKQDAKDQMYAKEREDRNDAQVKVASEHDAVLKTQQRAFKELPRNMATQLISSNLSVLGSVALKFLSLLTHSVSPKPAF
jgi:exonuclease VII large subunit